MEIKLRIPPHKDYIINREEKKIKLIIKLLIILPIVFALSLGYKYFTVKKLKEQCILLRNKYHLTADKNKKEFLKIKSRIAEFKGYSKNLGKMEEYFTSPVIIDCVGKVEECLNKIGIVKKMKMILNTEKNFVAGSLEVEFNNVGMMTQAFGKFLNEGNFFSADIVEISLSDPCKFKINVKYKEINEGLTEKVNK